MTDTTDNAVATTKPKGKRGFASMDPAKQKEIASKGGRVAHTKGTAHEFTRAEAQEAGKRGGSTVAKDRKHMAEIGRKGGQMRGKAKKQAKAKAAETEEAAEASAE